MFLGSFLSHSFLLLASGSSIYILKKHVDNQHSSIQRYFISASIGILGLCFRSLGSLFYNFFIRTYPIDPHEIENEWKEKEEINKRPFRNYSLFYRFFSTVGQAGLIYAVCDYHKSGFFRMLVLSLTVVEFICAIEAWKFNRRFNRDNAQANFLEKFAKITDGVLDFLWILLGGYFGWAKRNSFCLLAFLPFTISILMLSSEEFNKNPNIQIGFNDYMTIAHIILMTEAIRYNVPE